MSIDRECKKDEVAKAGCVDIEPKFPVEILNFNGAKICGQKENLTYYDLHVPYAGFRWLKAVEESEEDNDFDLDAEIDRIISNTNFTAKDIDTDKIEEELDNQPHSSKRLIELILEEIGDEQDVNIKVDNESDFKDNIVKAKNDQTNSTSYNEEEEDDDGNIDDSIDIEIDSQTSKELPNSKDKLPENSKEKTTPVIKVKDNDQKLDKNPEKPHINTNSNCKEGYKGCGNPNENHIYPYCIPHKMNCPINDIKIVTSNVFNIPNEYQKIRLNEDWNLIYTTKGDNMPIADFSLNPVNCFQEDSKIYPLLNVAGNEAMCIGASSHSLSLDARYDLVGQTDQEELLTDNNIDDILALLPNIDGYAHTIADDFNLYAKSYIPWNREKPQCSTNGEIDLAYEAEEYNSFIQSSNSLLQLMARTATMFMVISTTSIVLMSLVHNNSAKRKRILNVSSLIAIIVFIVFLFIYV